MRGEILTYDQTTETGSISGDDSLRYSFTHADIQGGAELAVGARVDFVPNGETASQIVVLAANPTPYGQAGHAPMPTEPAYDFKTAMIDFKGRLRRQHFWISWLILLGASVVLGWIPVLGTLISIALIWPNIAIMVKRLHDMGKPGLLVLIPIAGWIVGTVMIFSSVGMSVLLNPNAFASEDPAMIMSMVGGMLGGLAIMGLVGIAFLLWIGITDSQPGDNKYGPNPKNL